ncbi:MAG: hypothetical protein M1830_003391 [Pleopsidium flavum]|nr:MAG: hypothetical protein M1830_003391 [Pleopsidium flavum]
MDQNPSGSGQQQQRQQPVYDISNGGHYGLHGNYRDILTTYWQQMINHLETDSHDYKLHQLPLARIKKVMKADPEVKMISAEAPILFAKGCDIFITELTMRAWIHAEENKRRTLQRSDIASALAKSDMFDFLIDIVPREEAASHAKRNTGQAASVGGAGHASSSSGGLPHPQSNVQQQTQPGHPQQQHHMGPPEYAALGQHAMPQEQEYRPQPGMYAAPVPNDPTSAYGQPQQQMFEGMYGYPAMPPQQLYQVSQRGQDPSTGQDPGHHYSRHDGGEGDADAEGERDYEVG